MQSEVESECEQRCENPYPIWQEYLDSSAAAGGASLPKLDQIRKGCEPFFLTHPSRASRASVVLLHGLTDSPWFMRGVADYLHKHAGMDVYVPLLQGHGLKRPDSMSGVSHLAWLANAAWAVRTARSFGGSVSVGGLSTGGAIATLLAFRDQDGEDLRTGQPNKTGAIADRRWIDGGLFLFSSALRLQKRGWLRGQSVEALLRSPIGSLLDLLDDIRARNQPLEDRLIGDNPYRYAVMDKGGARELAMLIRLLDRKRRRRFSRSLRGLSLPVFIAHSDSDQTADIRALENLGRSCCNAHLFTINKAFAVPHASVVLKQTVFGDSGSPLEPANPFFDEMMRAALRLVN